MRNKVDNKGINSASANGFRRCIFSASNTQFSDLIVRDPLSPLVEDDDIIRGSNSSAEADGKKVGRKGWHGPEF